MARCSQPWILRESENFILPCGKCYECLKKRSATWSYRLKVEEKRHFTSAFVTLTYPDENVPLGYDDQPTFYKPDLQKYIKRVRKRALSPIKYYAVAEYGGKTLRPHYHLIIFGATNENLAISAKNYFGHIVIEPVNAATIRYVTNYILKQRLTKNELNGREPEFSLISNGIGEAYITDKMKKWHHNGLKNFCQDNGGQKIAMPRYYKDRIFNENQKKDIFDQVQEISQKIEQQAVNEYGGYTQTYNAVKSKAFLDRKLLSQTTKKRNQNEI